MQSDKTITIPRRGFFSIDDVIREFRACFLSESACRDWVMKRIHPTGAYCPGCHVAIPEKSLQRFWNSQRVKCCQCNKFFDARTGTFLSGCQMDYREVILLAVLLTPDITDKIIADILNISAENVRLWRNKFEALEKIKNG